MRNVAKMIFLLLPFTAVLASAPKVAAAQGDFTASFDTSLAGGNYDPRNIVAAWIEDANGAFVKTLGRWADRRIDHLVAWSAVSGQDADAVSGATRPNHNARLTVTWDMTDRATQTVPDGDYVLRLELSDRNATTAGENNQGSFPFTKDGQPNSQTVAGGGFNDVAITIAYEDPANCGNGVLDAGETCDPVDSCPTSCAINPDLCVLTDLVGSAADCTAACAETTITTCVHDDGCCAADCTAALDNDCGPKNDGASNDSSMGPVTGGCTTGGGASGPMFLLVLGALFTLRRRRSGILAQK